MKAAKKLLTLFFCLSFVFLAYQSAASSPVKQEASKEEKWEYYASDEEGASYFYNPGNLQRPEGSLVRVWVRAIYSGKNPRYSLVQFQWEIDCTKKRMRGLSAEAKMKDGTSTIITESSEWSPIPSNSTAETLYETVCKQKSKRTP